MKKDKYLILTWLICFLLCFAVENIFAADFYYDVLDYWHRGEELWGDGDLNLLSVGGFRGYVFPLFLGICNHYAGKIGWRVMNAAMMSTLFMVIIPYIFRGGGGMLFMES